MTEPAGRPALVRCAFCNQLNRVDLARLADGPRCGDCSRPMRLDRPQKLTDADFDQLVGASAVPVVVDFYADWCGPCRMMAPALDEFARARTGEVLVFKLDTDRNPLAAERFGIRGIPTLVAFRGGAEVRRHTGMADARVLAALVD